jgi:RNA polymerase sigma-70 factor (ECF subfamily)
MREPKTTRAEPNHLADACRELVLRRRQTVRGSPEAEDLEQEAVLRALDAPNSGAIRDPLRYLMRVTRNLFIDGYRRKQREALALASIYPERAPITEVRNPERILSGKDDLRCVLQAIKSLPPRCQQAFVLHRFNNLSYPAIARKMGVSTGTVEKHIAEAILRITRSLNAPEEF